MLVIQMIEKLKKVFWGLFGFVICLSVVIFLVSLLHLVIENTDKNMNGLATIFFATIGCCYLILMFVYKMVKE